MLGTDDASPGEIRARGSTMRIVILTIENPFANIITERLIREFPGHVVGIVRSDCLIYGKGSIAGLVHLWRITGARFIARKATEVIQGRTIAARIRLAGRKPNVPSLRSLRLLHRVPVVGSTDVNSPATLRQIKGWRPDLAVSIYLNQRIKSDLIDLPSRGILNVHPALLPRNRGILPCFWALARDESSAGATVHWVDERFDTGPILLQEKLSVRARETVISLSYRSAVLGADLLAQAVSLIASGRLPRIPQDDHQAYYRSWPNRAEQRRFRRKGGRYGTIREIWRYLPRRND